MTFSVREPAMQALFDLVSGAADYKTTSRKLRLWGDTPKEERPSLMMHELDDDVQATKFGLPQTVYMHVNFFIYTDANVKVPATVLNPLIDSVFAVLAPNVMTGKQNLGLPYVDHCYISGKVFKDTGDLDGDGLAVIPVIIQMATPLVFPNP